MMPQSVIYIQHRLLGTCKTNISSRYSDLLRRQVSCDSVYLLGKAVTPCSFQVHGFDVNHGCRISLLISLRIRQVISQNCPLCGFQETRSVSVERVRSKVTGGTLWQIT